ncbi:MAG: hypothetical protein F6K18_09135 [Okeania sp. SIO2C2]|uniref:hypothetical protein n=1 Tax=Okeania sp. SIO2C2 TaxID=2607787 RepID=UPI0013BA4A8C|nr:hypothetical protein [Okeania sp. SIO2C2]NEP86985.1 hypothetical protein [Okeania sp. SIO2C2]
MPDICDCSVHGLKYENSSCRYETFELEAYKGCKPPIILIKYKRNAEFVSSSECWLNANVSFCNPNSFPLKGVVIRIDVDELIRAIDDYAHVYYNCQWVDLSSCGGKIEYGEVPANTTLDFPLRIQCIDKGLDMNVQNSGDFVLNVGAKWTLDFTDIAVLNGPKIEITKIPVIG